MNIQELKDTGHDVSALTKDWHQKIVIDPEYMPPYPTKDTAPSIQAYVDTGSEHPPFLRGVPKEGGFFTGAGGKGNGAFFWDVYGEEYTTIADAITALSRAPDPVDVGPITFKFKLDDCTPTKKKMTRRFAIIVSSEGELPDMETLKKNLLEKIEEIIVDGLWLMEKDAGTIKVTIKD